MGGSLDINRIPIPLLIINKLTKNVTANKFFVDVFGTSILTVEELKNRLHPTFKLEELPNTPHIQYTNLKIEHGSRQVRIISNRFSDNEYVLTIEPFHVNIAQLMHNEIFRQILSGIPLGIIVKNTTTGENYYVSEYLINKIGYSEEEIAQKPWVEFTYKDDIAYQDSILNESLHKGLNTFYFDKRIVAKSGKIYWFSEYIKIFEHEGESFQVILLRDITNEKEIETELQRAKYLVEDADRLKSAFLDNMPHEIRTPLHAITGFTSLLSDSDLSYEERLEYVRFIQDSSNDILNLMDNIIEIAKLETNQVKPKREKCYVNSIIDKLLNDLTAKQNILEKEHLTIKVKKGNKDPLFTIISDPERLYQIMSHLLNNALKFTDVGEIEFGYSPPKDKQIEFFVKDTGIGIDPEERNFIFKKFGKSGNINTNKNRGSGLGLTLSQKLIELLNGEITLESKKGAGSTFKFHFPLENEPKISITKPSVSGDTNWSSKTILIAEDTESNYFFIEAFLERTHVNLLWAQDGVEAVNLFRTNHVNMVLMDIMMPEKDGYDATREIKEINPDIPVIAQTALALPDDEEKCYNAGCDYVLIKPINSEDLIATIKRFIL